MIVPRFRGRYVPMPILVSLHALLCLVMVGAMVVAFVKMYRDMNGHILRFFVPPIFLVAALIFLAFSVGFIVMAISDYKSLKRNEREK